MKKFFAIALALFFVAATSSLVLADDTAAPPAKAMKAHKHKKHHKKTKGSKTAPVMTPGAK